MKHFSKIVLSALAFISVQATAQIYNPGFEEWDTLSVIDGKRLHEPLGWQTANDYMLSEDLEQPVTYSTDARTGNYAMKLNASLNPDGEQVSVAISGSGFAGINKSGEKFKLEGKPKKFGAYIKYQPDGQDSLTMVMFFFKQGQILGSAYIRKKQTFTDYTKIEQDIMFIGGVPMPDSAKIMIIPTAAQVASNTYLIIDDLFVEYDQTTGLSDSHKKPATIGVYPNPANEKMVLNADKNTKLVSAEVIDILGVRRKIALNENQIDVSGLAQGTYFIIATDEASNQYKSRFVKN